MFSINTIPYKIESHFFAKYAGPAYEPALGLWRLPWFAGIICAFIAVGFSFASMHSSAGIVFAFCLVIASCGANTLLHIRRVFAMGTTGSKIGYFCFVFLSSLFVGILIFYISIWLIMLAILLLLFALFFIVATRRTYKARDQYGNEVTVIEK